MKTTIWIPIVLTMTALSTIVRAQTLETNVTPSQVAAMKSDLLLPLIKFDNVPITTAIENLARQAGINYIIDPQLFPKSESNPEPTMTFRLTNISANDALTRMLAVRGLVMVKDPVTTVSRITRKNQPLPVVDASLLNLETNNPAPATNDLAPLIQFSDAPLETGLEALIRQSGVDVKIDPRITTDGTILSIRWENLTVKQALIAICQNYDLEIVKDETTGAIQIKPRTKTKK